MFDVRTIRDNPVEFDAGLAKRGYEPMAERVLTLDSERRACMAALQEAQARRNEASKEIARAKAARDEPSAQSLIAEVAALKNRIQEGEERERQLEMQLVELLATIPNLPLDDVPVGPDESVNVEVRRQGAAPSFAFPPREHFVLGEGLGLMDFETAAKLSGARFVLLRGPLARLERALAAFMLDIHTLSFGYTEIAPPLLVRDEAMFGTAQLPKFAEDQFQTREGYWLVPTAEVPLTNTVRDSILTEAELPLRLTAWTPCFRAEAGAAGRDTRGLIRLHQFPKVELVSVTTPERSADELERMTACAEAILQQLGLHYRVMLLASGDMGFAARKTYDLEVWMAGQQRFREISSCSLCGEFQARRMQARYRPEGEKGTRFVHTLNGSGLAVGRTMAALLEHYQREDGSITVPQVLRPYMGGLEEIQADEQQDARGRASLA